MKTDKKTNVIFNIIAIISIILLAIAVSQKSLQNDTFYTVKIGEYIMEHGITLQDPFSWHTLSYTYPHWAYDVMMYFIYNIGGHLGIYLSTICFAAILGIIMYFINDKLSNNKPMSFVLAISALFLLRNYMAARAQLFSFILFALEILFIEGFLDTGKKRYIFGLIIIPMVLANVHVAVFPFYFVLYLPYIAEYIIAWIFELIPVFADKKIAKIEKKIETNQKPSKIENLTQKLKIKKEKREKMINYRKKEAYKITVTNNERTKILIIIMIICLFTGLFTPLKDAPYTYLLKTLEGNSTKNISEHLPLVLSQNINFAVVLLFFISILTFTDTKIRLCDLFMIGGLTALAFMSRRQESMFLIVCIPIFNRLVTSFIRKYDKDGIDQMKKFMASFLGGFCTISLALLLCLVIYKNKINEDYISKKSYPVEASEWILENLEVENIKLYNGYNYGSYLLFKGIPVFIDSRADLYLPEFNENVKVFEDFIAISNLNTHKLEEMFDKYGFTHFLTTADAKLRIYLDVKPDEYNKIYSDSNFCLYEKL